MQSVYLIVLILIFFTLSLFTLKYTCTREKAATDSGCCGYCYLCFQLSNLCQELGTGALGYGFSHPGESSGLGCPFKREVTGLWSYTPVSYIIKA